MYPIENTQAYFTANNMHLTYPDGKIRGLDLYINAVADRLYKNQLDFNFLDSASLENAKTENGKLIVGLGAYRVIIMPNIEIISLKAMQKLAEFADAGGTVIWLDALPKLAAGAGDTKEMLQIAERFKSNVMDISDAYNLAAGSRITASGTDDGYDPYNIIDGDLSPESWKHWSDINTPAWLELELDGAKTFDYFELYTKSDYELTRFTVSYLGEDGEWRQLFEPVNSNRETVLKFGFEPVTASKIKIDMPRGSRAQANIPRVTQIIIGLSSSEDKNARTFTDVIKEKIRHNISFSAGDGDIGDIDNIFVSPYIKDGKKLYYVVNSVIDDAEVIINSNAPFDLYDPYTGEIKEYAGTSAFTCKGYMGYFVVEK